MPAAKFRLVVESNGQKHFTFFYKDANQRPVNLTGYDALLVVKDSATQNILIDLSPTNGGITLTPLKGQITLGFTLAQLQNAANGGVYDLVLYPPVGDSIRLIEGIFAVSQGVTPA